MSCPPLLEHVAVIIQLPSLRILTWLLKKLLPTSAPKSWSKYTTLYFLQKISESKKSLLVNHFLSQRSVEFKLLLSYSMWNTCVIICGLINKMYACVNNRQRYGDVVNISCKTTFDGSLLYAMQTIFCRWLGPL